LTIATQHWHISIKDPFRKETSSHITRQGGVVKIAKSVATR